MKWLRWIAMFKGARRRFKDGSQLRTINRDFYAYVESDGRTMEIQADLTGLDAFERVVVSRSLERWSPPHENELVKPEKRDEILTKLRRYFDERYITYRVD